MALGTEAATLDKALTTEEAASFLASTRRTLESWRHLRRGPNYIKQGRSVRYRLRDLLAFQEKNLTNPDK